MKTMWSDCLKAIDAANRVAVFMHCNADGDAIGSAYALAAALLRGGKAVCVFTEEIFEEKLSFLVYDKAATAYLGLPLPGGGVDEDFCFLNGAEASGFNADVGIAVDCATAGRMSPACRAVFEGCPVKIKIDHHLPCEGSEFADINISDPKWAATAEGLWQLIALYCDGKRCDAPDYDIAVRLYTAILTDTGRFVYTNTTGNTLRTAAELVDITGTDLNWIARRTYDIKKPRVVKLLAEGYAKAESFFEGKVIFLILEKEDFERAGALISDSNVLPPELMNVEGAEISVFAKPSGQTSGSGETSYKISMRSTKRYNVACICSLFGGGGHACSAGCTFYGCAEELKKKILEEIGKII